eukprot:TRINITY_DN3488_c0_g1_i2.p1 TRINITY_DN3488_c0_g1~~TRINITY_DN3488_c0_g1_i2.p1  ORF type:complete len:345 (+),score=74.48 TRINITY_DN3488_c0_g1_i2:100-1134(+)
MIRRPPRSTLSSSSAASDVYKRQVSTQSTGVFPTPTMAGIPLSLLLLCALASATTVPIVTLNNGVKMPVIAAGTWQYTPAQAQAATTAAINAGFTHIDTAYTYTDETGVGTAIAASGMKRSDVFLTTKVPGCGLANVSLDNCGPDSLTAAEDNLKQLGLDYVDLLLVHFPPSGGCGADNCVRMQQQWAALSTLLAANKTRALGVSNYCVSCLECLKAAGGITPALNQVEYHVGQGSDPETSTLIQYCAQQNVVLEAYSPLGTNSSELISGPLVTSIGAAHNKTGVQVALRWIWQNGVTLTTKSANPSHLAADLDIFDWSLTDEEMKQLDAATTPKGTPSFMCTA